MKRLISILALLGIALTSRAVNPHPASVGVSYAYKITGTGNAIMTVPDELGTRVVSVGPIYGTTVESAMSVATMVPGQEYTITFQSSGITGHWLTFYNPDGYMVFIDDKPRELFFGATSSSAYTGTHTVVVRPVNVERRDAGIFSGVRVGSGVTWDIGLGGNRSGHSMGLISFRQSDLANSPSSRDHVIYTPPISNFQCTVVTDGSSGTRIRQVSVAQTVVDLPDDGTGGYWIKFYAPSEATWNTGSGGYYSFTGSPWKTFHVESPAANQLKVTETEDSVDRVSLVYLNSGVVSTGTYELILQEGSTSSWTRTVVHTSTAAADGSRDDVVVTRTGGTSGTIVGKTKYRYNHPGALNTAHTNTINYNSSTHPLTVVTGGSVNFTVNVTNSGTNTYGSNHSVALRDSGGTVLSSYGLSGLAPGNNTNATFSTTAPGTPGRYLYTIQGREVGGAGWIGSGALIYINVVNSGGTGSTDTANYNSTTFPLSVMPGQTAVFTTNVTNTGTNAWGSNHWLKVWDGTSTVWSTASLNGVGSLSSASAGLTLPTLSPSTGTYCMFIQAQNNTTWFPTSATLFVYVNSTSWGEELVQIIDDPDTAALTKTITYYTDPTSLGNYRRVKSVTEPTGDWTAFTYSDDWYSRGRVVYECHPYLDSPSTAASASTTTGRVIYYEYVADWTGLTNRKSLRQEKINNVETGRTVYTYVSTATDQVDTDSYRDGSNYQRARVENVRNDDLEWANEVTLVKNPDLSQTSRSGMPGNYVSGTFTYSSTGVNWREMVVHGSSSSSGANAETAFGSQAFDSIYQIPYKSTLDLSIRDVAGNVIRVEHYVYTASHTWTQLSYETFSYDDAGRMLIHEANNGRLQENTYTAGKLTSTKDAQGIETQFTYDAIGRVATSIKKGASATGYTTQGDITTTYTYDGANRITQTQVSASSLTMTSTAQFDLAGRQTQSVAPGSYTTGVAYSSGGKIVTTTMPGGATKITETYLDGQLKTVSGTGVVAESHTPAIDTSTGRKTVQSYQAGNSSNWSKTYFDWIGRATEVWRPEWNGSNYAKTSYYNSYGQVYKVSQQGMADTLYVYDTQGIMTREGLDVNGNGVLDLASNDRITDRGYTYWTWDSGATWWLYKPVNTYATSGSSTAVAAGGDTTERVNLPSGCLSETYVFDTFGKSVHTTVSVNRTTKVTTKTTAVTESSTSANEISFNGLLVSSSDTAGITHTFGYDALGRRTTDVDPRTGTTTTTYITGTTQVSTVTDPASVVQATYTYSSAGQVETLTNGLSKVARYEYDALGNKVREWGDTTYPVEYTYDGYGRMTHMRTYRGGTNWTNSTWPGGTYDETTWTYNTATGLLASKTDVASRSMSYTYTTARQLATRTDARSVVTTYSYDSATGEQTGVSYSDSTPSITYTYNRLGKTATVTDFTGTRTFTYNLSGTLELQNEILGTSGSDFYADHRVTRGYDSIGRYNALYVGSTSNYSSDFSQGFAYDTYGRLNQAWSFNYSYAANSNLVDTISYPGWNYTDTRYYDPYHDWTNTRMTSINSVSKSRTDATRDNIGRITAVHSYGEIYNRYGDGNNGISVAKTYDDRSQVTGETTWAYSNSTSSWNVMTGRTDTYTYDPIGNRVTAVHNSNTAAYTANALNQYTQRTVPGVYDVTGAAATSATVTVNSSSAGITRTGEFFYKGHALSNSGAAVFANLTVSDGTTTNILAAFLPGTPEAMTYDYAGNMLTDGKWDYTYDAESRIKTMQTHASLSPGTLANADARRIEFDYDYLGRRVQKTVRAGYNGTSFTTVITYTRFLYDGWNLLFEYNAAAGMSWIRAYMWGLDISGSLYGAGGVGGMLFCYDAINGKLFAPAYDLNGNITAMIDSSNGSVAAAYEYDAFGQTIRQSGTYATNLPFRFSSKYTDDETALIYYGTRYYSPSQGRFIGRDPIEEKGGLHLYAFCRNNGVNAYDYLGMDCFLVQQFLDDGTVYWADSGGASFDDLDQAARRSANNQSWMSYAEGAAAGALAAVDAKALATLQTAQGNGTIAWSNNANGATVTSIGADVNAALAWLSADISQNSGVNLFSSTSTVNIGFAASSGAGSNMVSSTPGQNGGMQFAANTTANQAAIVQTVGFLAGSASFNNEWGAIAASGKTLMVGTYNGGPGQAAGSTVPYLDGASITFDIGRAFQTPDGRVFYPTDAFAHETDHAFRMITDRVQFDKDYGTPTALYGAGTVNEAKAFEFANRVAGELGRPLKRNYYDGATRDTITIPIQSPLPPRHYP